MKWAYIVLGIVVLVAVSFIVRNLLQSSVAKSEDNQIEEQKGGQPQSASPYLELRSQALHFPPDQFGTDTNSNAPVAYGVVMDWNVGRGILTFASFSSGDASMYTSSGGGMIGGVGHEKVKDAAKGFVRKAQEYVAKANRSDDIATPKEDGIKFFILTTQGRFVANEEIGKLR